MSALYIGDMHAADGQDHQLTAYELKDKRNCFATVEFLLFCTMTDCAMRNHSDLGNGRIRFWVDRVSRVNRVS